MHKMRILMIIAVSAISTNAAAASLITDSIGYTGPTLDLSQFANNPYNAYNDTYATFSDGPINLPGGITYTATGPSALLGKGTYGFGNNGKNSNTFIIATGGSAESITLAFANAVSSFGAGFNYAPDLTDPVYQAIDPYIRAYDAGHNLIAEYNLANDAPISFAANSVDQYAFRGIDGGGIKISTIEFGGSYIAAAGTIGAVSAVPEPASWGLLMAGFGLLGLALRRRKSKIAQDVDGWTRPISVLR